MYRIILLLFGNLLFHAVEVAALSIDNQKPVKRVAIIGAGVAGLALAHALEKDNQVNEISIYEARPKLDPREGAGFQINGGLAAFDPHLKLAVAEAGLPLKGIQSRSKAWFGDPQAKDFSTLLQIDIRDMIAQAGEEVSEALLDTNGNPLWITITRGALQKVLEDELSQSTKVSLNKQLVNMREESDGVLCEFSDGTVSGPFDMVVGCDGIRSSVKEYIDSSKITTGSLAPSDAIYSGIRIRFAVADRQKGDPRAKGVKFTQYFGDGGYALRARFGAGAKSPDTDMALIVYLDKNYVGPFELKKERGDRVVINENADWTQTVEQILEDSRMQMLSQIEEFNIPDKESELESAIRAADRIYELGSYFHNPFNKWSKVLENGSCVVLCGDSAHAMPPFLGQGSNQAIQSSYCLASKVAEYNQQFADSGVSQDTSLDRVLSEYRNIRWPPTFNILWKALFLGYLETGGAKGVFSKFRDTFFQTMGMVGVAKRVLLSAAVPKVK